MDLLLVQTQHHKEIKLKTIKINFEYKSFPVWIYDEDENLIANDLPDFLIGNEEIDPVFVKLQQEYDSLYLDDGKEFKFKGFSNPAEENAFNERVEEAKSKLKELLSDSYLIK